MNMHGLQPPATGKLQQADGGGWSKSGNLLLGVPGTTLTMLADFPDSDDYTIQFGIAPNVNNGAFQQNALAEALITWSVAGNDVSRRISITNGISISGTAQGVKVVMMDVSTASDASLKGLPYAISCQVARGTRAAIEQPPTLVPVIEGGFIRLGAPDATVSVDVPIPADAGAISYYATILARDGLGAPVPYVEGWVIVTQIGASMVTEKDFRNPSGWIPLLPGATSLQFKRENLPSPADSVLISVVFGIDG